MVTITGAATKHRSGLERSNAKDEFELSTSQCFLGPKEFELQRTEFSPLTFGYDRSIEEDDKQIWGVVQFETAHVCYRTTIDHIERVTLVPPSVTQSNSTAVIFWLSKTARIRFRQTLDISRETMEKIFPLSQTNHSDAFRYLIFLIKPWNPINSSHLVRANRTRKPTFYGYDELKSRLTGWFVKIRREDIETKKASETTFTKEPFIKELSTSEWLEFAKHLNLKISNCSRVPGLTELRYFRPGQVAASAQTQKTRPVEVYSMIVSSEKSPERASHEEVLKHQNGEIKKAVKRSSMESAAQPPKKTKKPVVTLDLSVEDATKSTTVLKLKPGTSGQNLLTYGEGHHKITLFFNDVGKLAPEQLLNDNIIEFYLRYLQLEHTRLNTKDDTYIFSTFLFSRLVQQPSKAVVQRTKRGAEQRRNWVKKNYESVKKWTRNVDIFLKKLLIIPVNYEEHWYLIIVRNPGNCRRLNGEAKGGQTLIYTFNSLVMEKCAVTQIAAEVIKDYLILEFNDKKKESGETLSEKGIQTVQIQNLTGQMNLIDCGLYVLGYTEIFLMWTPKSESKQLNFNEWWPLFQTTVMTRMRYKILSILRKKSDKETWQSLKEFEERRPTEFKSTEELLEDELRSQGLRRWQSETDIRPTSYRRFRKRTKSLGRQNHDDQYDRTFDNFEQ